MRPSPGASAAAAVVGLVVDRLLGEPPARWHPVAGFGRLMAAIERRTYRDDRLAGAAHLGVGVAVAGAAGWALRRCTGPAASTALAVAACAAGRMLDDEALAVAAALDAGDLDAARARVGGLVGRETGGLDEEGVSRAVVESVAENSVDAVVATLWWAAVGGAPAALVHRAVNTLDAMVGHRDARYGRFGWASARADDLANLVPARLAALGVAAARPGHAAAVWRVVRRDAGRHPSPNGGVIEAAYAAALGVRLGGSNRYGERIEDRGTLGDGGSPQTTDVARAVGLRRRSTALVATALVCASVARGRLSSWR